MGNQEPHPYTHCPVDLLPASLLAPERNTVSVLALMQREGGLNRDLRRELAGGAKGYGTILNGSGLKLQKSEMSVLSWYLNPHFRFSSFWNLARARNTGRGFASPKTCALAVDFALLNAYEPAWLKVAFDPTDVAASCPEWPMIEASLRDRLGSRLADSPLQAFMLWPRLLKDLAAWSELEADRRRVVGRAVFALSSISMSDWFIRTALEHCPELEPELGSLINRVETKAVPQPEPAGDGDEKRASPVEQESQESWQGLVDQLDALGVRLRESPSRALVQELTALCARFELLASSLPDELGTRARCEQKVTELLERIRSLSRDCAFAWLESRLVGQLEARWHLALRRSEGEAALSALAVDADEAADRGDEAATRYRTALEDRDSIAVQIQRVEEELNSAAGLTERRALERRRRDLQLEHVNADAALPTFEDELLAAFSPEGEPFDHEADYLGKLADEEGGRRATLSEQGHGATVEPEPGAGDSEPEPSLGAPAPAGPGEDASTGAGEPAIEGHDRFDEVTVAIERESTTEPGGATGADAGAAPTTGEESADGSAIVSGQLGAAVEPTSEREPSAPEPRNEFSVEAGEACRPIWSLLKKQELSLAYQLAAAMERRPDPPRVPYPPLLASVALANRLVLPDGSIREALAQQYQLLDANWFVADQPRCWHQAVNLLLVAATLRSTILAPSTGASSIAGYLHLDGHYAAVYELMTRLRRSSELLQGFRIEPATLKLLRDEAALEQELKTLGAQARDWLQVQAPAITIKFQAATKVWHHWLRPDGVVSQLVAPVVTNRQADLQRVKELIATLSDPADLNRKIRETDRREVGRRTGEDIYAGALEHLQRCAGDAIHLARRWVTLSDVKGKAAGRMHELLEEVRADLRGSRESVEQELRRQDPTDEWGLIETAQAVALAELRAVLDLFDPAAKLPPVEPDASEALGSGLLLVPSIGVGDDWTGESDHEGLIEAVSVLVREDRIDTKAAFQRRLERGDLHGAERLAASADPAVSDDWLAEVRRECETWRGLLSRALVEARREVEIGSAYGYLSEAERNAAETNLVRLESQADEVRRFDLRLGEVVAVQNAVRHKRDERTAEIRSSLAGLRGRPGGEEGADQIERVLEQGDLATAREMLQRLAAGLSVWPESQGGTDRFAVFFPGAVQALEGWLSSHTRPAVESAIRHGPGIPGLDFSQVAGAQREQAGRMYAAWADLKAKKQGDNGRLVTLLSGLGIAVQRLSQLEKIGDREFWSLETSPIEDRNVCPIPEFGSGANGRYRVVCVWQRPTEGDIVQLIGDSTLQRATIVLYFGRMTDRKWRETSRLAKTKRRAFLLVDEVMLTYLSAEAGSRLDALFEIALPFGYSTPYDATAGLVPPEMFYGRGAELDAVRGLNGRCFIYGGRQLGKTALLRRAEQSFHAPAQQRYSRWIDLRAEGIGVSKTPSDVWVCVTEQLKGIGALDASVPIPSPSKKGSVDTVLAAIRESLTRSGDRRVLLLLDEADRFFEQDGREDFAETRRLKQLMDDTGRRFKVVFAGLHNVLRMTERANHPLAHFGEPIKIGPLVEEHEVREAEDLVRRPFAAAGFAFESRNLVIRILAQTNYYPSLIQLYCSHLLRHMLDRLGRSQRDSGPRYLIADRDIESVYSSGALRDEIRSKFRLTLQLDPRYEVVAYALAYEALRGRYGQGDGMHWQNIRQAGAMHWWPEGFRDTTELDFRVLLDEMVELGVLSRVREGWYTLRNPNVLLLLGTLDEIESVLVKEREPAVEFESAVFRAPMRSDPSSNKRHPLTYQQLSELLRRANSVTAIAGTRAAGIDEIIPALKDYLGQSGDLEVLDDCRDRPSFTRSLDRVLKARGREGTTVVVVPWFTPWTADWVVEARHRLSRLSSHNRFVSMVFLAEPATLWRLGDEHPGLHALDVAWMSLLPWHDGFVRHWLQELHLPNDLEQRRRLAEATGNWPELLYGLLDGCTEAGELEARIAAKAASTGSDEERQAHLEAFGLATHDAYPTLEALAVVGVPVESASLADVADLPEEAVTQALHWADLLGLVRREGGQFWSIDPMLRTVIVPEAQ